MIEKDFLHKLFKSETSAKKLLVHASQQQYYVLSRIFFHILGGKIKISRSVLSRIKDKRKLSLLGEYFHDVTKFDSLTRAEQYSILSKLCPVLKDLLSPLFPEK